MEDQTDSSLLSYPSNRQGRKVNRWPWLKQGMRFGFWMLGLFILGLLATSWYFHSRLAASQLESHLSEVLASKVRIDSVAIGYQECSFLNGLCVETEVKQGTRHLPLIRVSQTKADLSVFDWLFGKQEPDQVDLHQALIQLQFDRHGSLLNKIPQPRGKGKFPQLILHNTTVRLEQEGVPKALEFQGLDTRIFQTDASISISGNLRDPIYGQWEISGWINPEYRAARLHLKTEATHLDRSKLENLPFVSSKVWQQIVIREADTAVDMTLDFSLDHPGVTSKITLRPKVKGLRVSSIHLDIEEAAGEVIIQDGLVTLNSLMGQTAGGSINASGTLDFRSPQSNLSFLISVNNLDLVLLPLAWKVPPHAIGHLTGKAQIEVQVNEGSLKLNGMGRGVVQHGLLGGVPLPIRLTTEDNHLHFGLPLPQLRSGARLRGPLSGRIPLKKEEVGE